MTIYNDPVAISVLIAVLAFAASIAVLRWVFRINKIVSELEAMRKALERLMSQPPDSP